MMYELEGRAFLSLYVANAIEQASIPSSWGMLGYMALMSKLHRIVFFGKGPSASNFSCKSDVSRMFDLNFVTRGERKKSTNCQIFSVGPPLPDTMPLPFGANKDL